MLLLPHEGSVRFLVRVDGKREMGLDRMTPRQYESYKTRTARAAGTNLSENLDYEYLRKTYALFLADDYAREDDGLEEDEGAEDAEG